ncbi:MAG: adenosine kinase, partial [Bacteroidales bacterium]
NKNGVHTFLSLDTITSGCAMTMITPDGERTFGTYLGAAGNLEVTDLRKEMFLGYDYLFIEGYLVQSPEFIRHAVKMAKACGCKVVLDLASYNIVNANLEFFSELLQSTDIVFANEEEAFAYTQCEPREAARKLGQICPIAVVKIGPRGSYIAYNNEIIHSPATKAKCLDATGAGDLYAAGFLYGLSMNAPLHTCGEIGSLISGHVIECIGTKMSERVWNSIRKDVARMLNADHI